MLAVRTMMVHHKIMMRNGQELPDLSTSLHVLMDHDKPHITSRIIENTIRHFSGEPAEVRSLEALLGLGILGTRILSISGRPDLKEKGYQDRTRGNPLDMAEKKFVRMMIGGGYNGPNPTFTEVLTIAKEAGHVPDGDSLRGIFQSAFAKLAAADRIPSHRYDSKRRSSLY